MSQDFELHQAEQRAQARSRRLAEQQGRRPVREPLSEGLAMERCADHGPDHEDPWLKGSRQERTSAKNGLLGIDRSVATIFRNPMLSTAQQVVSSADLARKEGDAMLERIDAKREVLQRRSNEMRNEI